MDTIRAVQDLLFEHDCVIVPGFGAFIGHYREAFHNAQSSEFLPPSKRISFNRLLIQNDGLMATYLSESKQQAYQASLLLLQDEAKRWTDSLENTGNLQLKGLGYFKCDKEGKWLFTPALSENLNKASFGLSPIHQRILDRKASSKEHRANHTIQEHAPKVYAKAGKRNRRSTRFAVTVGAFILGMIGISQLLIFTDAPVNFKEAGMLSIYSTDVRKHMPADVDAHPYKALPKADQVLHSKHVEKAAIAIEPELKKETVSKTTPLASADASTTNVQGKYAIIKGCFKEKSNADRVQSQLTSEGKQVYVHEMKSGFTQVGYYAGTDESTAQSAFQQELKRQKDCYLKKL